MPSTGPAVILADDVRPPDLMEHLDRHRLGVRDLVVERGAVLFRGFEVGSAARFHAVARAFMPELVSYVHGNSPRRRVTDRVYTSTEYPSEYPITLHNELSYTKSPPSYLMFCCLVPAAVGGETLMADGRRLLEEVTRQVRTCFLARTIRYTQNLPDGAGFGKSWQDTFETEDAEQVMRLLREGGAEFVWKPDGGCG
ncbi:TauD/TfdA family dioxygenase [Amycolatopsis sp. QT-25]|uniref:TauD/TfdA family dioxygenase n=1 Tax=Amycolatopsis sp. QT-25 TaxID=3034022 RepID=UPI0023EBFE6E|nr:TauD/TfdA family dioxygenase [Amycolatopsis sp. QT-25]WET76531.1 TauD/TfdA family dioxygenase [Amycolatopsis sp. QT-25]